MLLLPPRKTDAQQPVTCLNDYPMQALQIPAPDMASCAKLEKFLAWMTTKVTPKSHSSMKGLLCSLEAEASDSSQESSLSNLQRLAVLLLCQRGWQSLAASPAGQSYQGFGLPDE